MKIMKTLKNYTMKVTHKQYGQLLLLCGNVGNIIKNFKNT